MGLLYFYHAQFITVTGEDGAEDNIEKETANDCPRTNCSGLR